MLAALLVALCCCSRNVSAQLGQHCITYRWEEMEPLRVVSWLLQKYIIWPPSWTSLCLDSTSSDKVLQRLNLAHLCRDAGTEECQ